MTVTLPLMLTSLRRLLPVHSEEVPVAEAVLFQELVEQVVLDTQVPEAQVHGSLEFLQHLWHALGLLDPFALGQGRWQFVSFPASLMARSLLESLAQEQPELLGPGFWLPGPNEDTQRKWLAEAETQRQNQLREAARPIRQVHVAWGLIRLQGRILVNHREDTPRPGRPNYVLIGGKLNLHDLGGSSALSPEALVRLQQAPPGELVQQGLFLTLERELREELGLLTQHYEARRFHRLEKPYLEIEGSRANHALTRYDISCFEVHLNASGFQRLCQTMQETPDGQLLWMTPEEVARGTQADHRVYIQAWLEEAGSSEKLLRKLQTLPESFVDPPLFAEGVDVPVSPEAAFLVGETGKEQKVFVELTDAERWLLVGMAWQALHGTLQGPQGVHLHPLGWMEFREAALLERVRTLQQTLEAHGLPLLQGRDSGWFRVSVAPEKLYLAEEFFEVQAVFAESGRHEVHLTVPETETPVGTLPATRFVQKVSEKVFQLVRASLREEPVSVEMDDPKRSLRAEVNAPARKWGLRIVFRSQKKGTEFRTDCLPVG